MELDTYLKSLGAKKSCLDNALYLFKRNDKLIGFVLSHVDDLCFGGEVSFHNEIISKVMKKYVIGAAEVFNADGSIDDNADGRVFYRDGTRIP